MTEKQRNAGNLKLLAGHLALDFTNTLDWRGRENPQEFLNTYHDLVLWSRHAGIANHEEAGQLGQMAAKSTSDAETVLNKAIHLRESLYRIFSAIAKYHDPSKKDLTFFNRTLSASMKDSRIVKEKEALLFVHLL